MMSESVTVTVQDGNRPAGAAKPGEGNFAISLNPLYFRSIPGILKIAQLEEQREEDQSEHASSASINDEEKEKPTEEDVELHQRRTDKWHELNVFLNNNSECMIDAVAFNTSVNLHTNDVSNLVQSSKSDRISIIPENSGYYKEKFSLIDLENLRKRQLVSASWHCQAEDVIVSAYLDPETVGNSLLAIWLLKEPLRPRALFSCEEKLSVLSFCPLPEFTNIIVGGCTNGKIVIWEINDRMIKGSDGDSTVYSHSRKAVEPLKEAMMITSGEKSQTQNITMLQWLPAWCGLETDGNFHLVTSDDSPKGYFASSSIDGSIFFWCLPSILSKPAELRNSLQPNISPIYRLIIEVPSEKHTADTRMPITCFSLPLAKNEESSSLNSRDQTDLERFRRIFLGNSKGEVVYCSWESQTFAVDITDSEVCKVIEKCSIHDGIVRSMTKSPHLDDVFLTVGGRVFALWKEDSAKSPIFHRRSPDHAYGEGCWTGRSGLFAIARLDGCFEVWDLKRSSEVPVSLESLSGKLSVYIYPKTGIVSKKLLAVQDGPSTLRVFVERSETVAEEDLERIEWFEKFVWRETKRKLEFSRWQDDYSSQHPTALQRKAEREQAEAGRKHREARERYLKLLGIICMACGSPGYYGASHWFLFVVVTAFIVTLLWSIIYLLSLRECLKLPINWILTEFINYVTYTVLYFTAFVAELAVASHARYTIAGVFGLINTLAYAASTYFLYLEWKNSQQ